jgi:hypothetical protein
MMHCLSKIKLQSFPEEVREHLAGKARSGGASIPATTMNPYEPIKKYRGRLLRVDVTATQLEVRGSPIVGRLP